MKRDTVLILSGLILVAVIGYWLIQSKQQKSVHYTVIIQQINNYLSQDVYNLSGLDGNGHTIGNLNQVKNSGI
jgi:hypothetical protein